MVVTSLRSVGVTSDVLHPAGCASIAGPLATWRAARSSGDVAHAERGIFIGLWAPTFFALADAGGTQEAVEG